MPSRNPSNMIKASEAIFNELVELRADFKANKISREQFAADLMAISQLEKQQKLILQTFITEAKLKKCIPVQLTDSSDPEKRMIACPDQNGKFITREMCLEYSGDSKNNETCSTCKEFNATRKMLISK